MKIISCEINCFNVLCLWRICRDLPLYILLCALPIVDWLSQCIYIASISFDHIGISSKKWQSHFSSYPTLSNAINLDSIVDLAVQVCLDDFQDTISPSSVKTYPLMDFVSFESDIQFASLYPSSTVGYLV